MGIVHLKNLLISIPNVIDVQAWTRGNVGSLGKIQAIDLDLKLNALATTSITKVTNLTFEFRTLFIQEKLSDEIHP